MRIRHTQRRDRMLLLSVLSIALLTLLDAAGESLGYDRWLTEPVNDIETGAAGSGGIGVESRREHQEHHGGNLAAARTDPGHEYDSSRHARLGAPYP